MNSGLKTVQYHQKRSVYGSKEKGPNGIGNFFNKGWQDSLPDKSSENEVIRKGVFGRMNFQRPTPKSTGRKGWTGSPVFYVLAFRRWWFVFHISILTRHSVQMISKKLQSRTTAGDPSTFTSVTELQYDRLVKWSKGDFTKIPVPEYKHFDKIPVDKQPAALTEATIGTPLIFLYRGKVTFTWFVRIGGPSVRPDSIVTEETHNIVSQSVMPYCAKADRPRTLGTLSDITKSFDLSSIHQVVPTQRAICLQSQFSRILNDSSSPPGLPQKAGDKFICTTNPKI
jgi:hypothetical protein